MVGIVREFRKRNFSAIFLSFDPTAAPGPTGKVLPAGAIPINVRSLGGATGGSSPTVHVGRSGNDDAYADELDADDFALSPGTPGAELGVALTAPTEIWAGVGASAAGGGTTLAVLEYIIKDAEGWGE